MLAEADMPMGLDNLKAQFTLKDYSAEVDKRIGKRVLFAFHGAIRIDGMDVALAMEMAGLLHTIDFGSWEPQKMGEKQFELSVDYLNYVFDGEPILEFDNFGGGLTVGGEDRTAARRAALGLI